MSSVRGRRVLPAAIMLAGLAIFLGLAAGCRLLYDQTENRLLEQRTNEAAAAIEISVGQIMAPLDAAAKLAAATNGDVVSFAKILAPYLGTDSGKFASAALYEIGSTTPITAVGAPVVLPIVGANSATSMIARARSSPFVVVDLLSQGRHLGYAVADAATNPQWVVYGERILSLDANIRRRTDEPFAQLNYAIYLGDQPTSGHLLGASVRNLPIRGRYAQRVVAFGDTNILLVMTPIENLSGDLFANLWWIVAGGGVLLSTAFALLTRRLLDRHDTALELAADNERLYDEQRHIAETLQLGLLPQHLVGPQGVSVAARYWPAGSANLIGGDFYDLFPVDDARWGLAIGDVCGKGIEAAALTGLARHTLRAAARNSTSPTEVLQAVHQALRDHQPATFCTACFGYISRQGPDSFHVELSLGGHPQPLLRHRDGRVESVGTLGMLLGMIEPTIATTVVGLQPGDTFVLYTDGLTDAPAEQAVSVDELAALLENQGAQPIEQLADSIRALKRGRRPLGSGDDTAVMILRIEGASPSTPTNGDQPATPSSTRS